MWEVGIPLHFCTRWLNLHRHFPYVCSDGWGPGATLRLCHFHLMMQEKILSREATGAQEPQAGCSLCCLNIYSAFLWRGWVRSAEGKDKRTGSSLPVPFNLGNNLHTTSANVMRMPCTCYTAQGCTSPPPSLLCPGFLWRFHLSRSCCDLWSCFKLLGWACLLISTPKGNIFQI